MDDTTAIELSRPVNVDGEEVGTLHMREPTVEDQITADESKGSDALKEVAMFANLCDVAPAAIRKLTLRDYRRVQVAYQGFID